MMHRWNNRELKLGQSESIPHCRALLHAVVDQWAQTKCFPLLRPKSEGRCTFKYNIAVCTNPFSNKHDRQQNAKENSKTLATIRGVLTCETSFPIYAGIIVCITSELFRIRCVQWIVEPSSEVPVALSAVRGGDAVLPKLFRDFLLLLLVASLLSVHTERKRVFLLQVCICCVLKTFCYFFALQWHLRQLGWSTRPLYTSPYIQESCAVAKMTARCADKSKQTGTPPPKITWLSADSIQPDVMFHWE